MSGKSSPRSDCKSLHGSQSSRGRECQVKVWSSDNQGRLMHWFLFELYSKYDPDDLHRKLDGLIFRVLTLPSASISPSDRDAIILLRRESDDGKYLLCIGREEPWQSVWPEDRIMTAIQNMGLATARFLGTTVARKGVIISGLTVGELLEEGKLWKKAQIQGHV